MVKEYVAVVLLHMAILPIILVLKRSQNKFCTFGKIIRSANDKPEELRRRGKSWREPKAINRITMLFELSVVVKCCKLRNGCELWLGNYFAGSPPDGRLRISISKSEVVTP